MNKQIEQLRTLIYSQTVQNENGNLTDRGQGYLEGLEAAFALVSGGDEW